MRPYLGSLVAGERVQADAGSARVDPQAVNVLCHGQLAARAGAGPPSTGSELPVAQDKGRATGRLLPARAAGCPWHKQPDIRDLWVENRGGG
jgi:hypothetical protein